MASGTAAGAVAQRPPDSIAALPFANLSGDPAQEYLADGLTEELLNALSRVPGLRVAARTSCFAFKHTTQDVRQVGERLGVRHVVEGGVRLAGKRLRLSVQLVDAASGFVLWSDTYERDLDDIFLMQREMATTIVAHVVNRPGAVEPPPPATLNVEAFTLYLHGRYHWNRRTEADLRRAIGYFEQAARLDPPYAPAWAGLADAYTLLLDYGGMSPAEALPPARDAVERALQLDPSMAEAYTLLALVRQFEMRWADADAAFRRSLALRPDYVVAHQRFALHLAWQGHTDEAVAEARRAEALDPLAVAVCASSAFVLYYARRFQDATKQAERALEMDPQFVAARSALGLALLQIAPPADAVEQFRQAVTLSGRAASTVALLATALAKAGQKQEGWKLLDELDARAQTGWVSSYYRAVPLLALGNNEQALDRLEAACEERAPQMAYVRAEPLFDPVRQSPRFHAVLQRIGLRAP